MGGQQPALEGEDPCEEAPFEGTLLGRRGGGARVQGDRQADACARAPQSERAREQRSERARERERERKGESERERESEREDLRPDA